MIGVKKISSGARGYAYLYFNGINTKVQEYPYLGARVYEYPGYKYTYKYIYMYMYIYIYPFEDIQMNIQVREDV